MMKLRKISLCAVAMATFAAAAAQVSAQPFPEPVRAAVRERVEHVVLYQQGREEQTDRQTKKLKIGTDGELSLSNIAGDIVVTRGSGSDAVVEIVKTARGRTADDAKQMLELVEVAVTERSGRAEVRTVYPRDENQRQNRRNVNVSVSYTVTAPAGTRLTVNSVSGGIRAADIKGDLALSSISGSVRIAGAGRITAAKSVSGDVEITDTQIDGGIDAQSISGHVLLRKVNARRVSAGSISGGVTVQDAQCERVEAHSISGIIEYSGALAKGGRYELTSHSGDVRIGVGSGTGFELEANSFSGSVRSDLPLTMQSRDGNRDRGQRRAMHGVFGDGSAVLNVTTFSGNIVISKR
jgi:DUF4097 and DUF4098 domain-containing protein YvlB